MGLKELIILIPVFLAAAPTIPYTVVRSIPHDRDAFTQGLIMQDGMIWESTGSPGGGTRIRQIDPADGRVVKSSRPDSRYFGEGLASDGVTLFQLSWQNQLLYLFRYPTIAPVATIPYKGEGWGLTLSEAGQFWMSNGSDTLTVRDCCHFQVVKRVPVKIDGRSLKNLNELEWYNRQIFANVWYSDSIVVINPSTGVVTGVINLKPLRRQVGASESDQVVNGIAAAGKNRFWVTGKFWPKLYLIELKVPQK